MKKLLMWLALATFPAIGHGSEQSLAWPQFRGPNGSGVADDEKPPLEIGPEKNLKWKVAVPRGASSPIVAGDQLVMTAFDGGKLYTIAYDRTDGREAWRTEAPAKQIEAFHKTEGSPAASTPATDGKRIVSYFGSCGVFCYDLAGKELWKVAMPPAVLIGEFGSGVSPIIAGDMVVLVRDQKTNSKIYSFDLATGAVRWEQKRGSPISYCTPIVWKTSQDQYIVAAGHARIAGYDLQTGTEKWFATDVPSGCCSSPVVAGNILLFAGGSPGESEDSEPRMPSFDSLLKDLDRDKDGSLSRDEAETAFAGFFDNQDANKDGRLARDEWDALSKLSSEGKNSAFALRPGGSGDVTESHVLWKQTKGLPYVPSAIAYLGQYIMVKDGGIVTAYDATTGERTFQERAGQPGTYYASPVAANGHVYLTSLEGALTVLKVDGSKLVVVENAKLGERTMATPAIADDTLFIRTEQHLYAFAERQWLPVSFYHSCGSFSSGPGAAARLDRAAQAVVAAACYFSGGPDLCINHVGFFQTNGVAVLHL
jgi:outer membrane protein assembly factor BamB